MAEEPRPEEARATGGTRPEGTAAAEEERQDSAVVLSSFEDVNPAAAALGGLQDLGVPDDDITVMSSLPWSGDILGRPHIKTRLAQIALACALVGLGVGIFLVVVTPYLYIVRVGGQPIVPVPPTALLLYEFLMLFLILGTFGGFLVLNGFPKLTPAIYDPKLNDGRVSLVVHAPSGLAADVVAILEENGGQVTLDPERREL
jgi:hypothetical protein